MSSPASSPDILQIQAATNLGIAQANEVRHRQLASQEQVLQWIHKEIDARSLDLQHREDQLTLQQQKVAEQKQSADKSLAEAQGYKDAALAERKKADELRNEAEKFKNEAQASQADADKKLGQVDTLFALPQSLQGESWKEWRLKLMTQVWSDGRSALVLSRLQVVSSLLRSPDNEQPVLEALAALGSAVCALDPQKAMDLATALTQGSQGAFEINLPSTNDNVDRIWMKAPPTTNKVARVIGWCVRDKQRVVQFPAQVE